MDPIERAKDVLGGGDEHAGETAHEGWAGLDETDAGDEGAPEREAPDLTSPDSPTAS